MESCVPCHFVIGMRTTKFRKSPQMVSPSQKFAFRNVTETTYVQMQVIEIALTPLILSQGATRQHL